MERARSGRCTPRDAGTGEAGFFWCLPLSPGLSLHRSALTPSCPEPLRATRSAPGAVVGSQGRVEGEMLTASAVHLALCDEFFCRAAGWDVGCSGCGVAASSPQPGQGARGGSPHSTAPMFCCYQPCLHQCHTRKFSHSPMPTPAREV